MFKASVLKARDGLIPLTCIAVGIAIDSFTTPPLIIILGCLGSVVGYAYCFNRFDRLACLKLLKGKWYPRILNPVVCGFFTVAAIIGYLTQSKIPTTFPIIVALLIIFKSLSDAALSWLMRDCYLVGFEKPETIAFVQPNEARTVREVPFDSIVVGSTIRLAADAELFFDGVVVSGIAEVEERTLSGKSTYKVKGVDDHIFAGSVILSSSLDVEVSATFESSIMNIYGNRLRQELGGVHESSSQQTKKTFESYIAAVIGALLVVCYQVFIQKSSSLPMSSAALALSIGLVPEFLYQLHTVLNRHLLISAYARGILIRDFIRSKESLVSLKRVVMDEGPLAEWTPTISVLDHEIIDARLDESALFSIIISILGRSQNPVHTTVSEYFRDRCDTLVLHEFKDADALSDNDSLFTPVTADIEGTNFKIGSDAWLVTKSVFVQPNEVSGRSIPEKGQKVFVSMNSDIIAAFTLVPTGLSAYQNLVKQLGKLDVVTGLLSSRSVTEVHDTAKLLGITLENQFATLTEEGKINKLSSLSPVILVANASTPTTVQAAATLAVAPVDQNRNELGFGPSIIVFDSEPQLLSWAMAASRRLAATEKFHTNISWTLLVCLPILVALFPLPPTLTLTFFSPVFKLSVRAPSLNSSALKMDRMISSSVFLVLRIVMIEEVT